MLGLWDEYDAGAQNLRPPRDARSSENFSELQHDYCTHEVGCACNQGRSDAALGKCGTTGTWEGKSQRWACVWDAEGVSKRDDDAWADQIVAWSV